MEWIKVKRIRLQYMGRSTSDIKGNHLTSMHLPQSTREDVKQVEHKMGITSEPSTLIYATFVKVAFGSLSFVHVMSIH